jgi:transcriptional regulator with PAS, ATPase and Fis domain
LNGAKLPVLLVGETGTGKERFARAIHGFAADGRPFHAINCAALPPTLVEAELFGYRKGAFTGADRAYSGQLRAAHGGTLVLDEVTDLPLSLQGTLLRVLDTGELAPLGETSSIRFEAQIVSASQKPLSELVAAGRFRDDLAARLSGLVVRLPPLRERRADIPRLFDVLLRERSGGTSPPVSTRLYESLCLSDWPGNVRELELLARQLLAVRGFEPLLRRSHLPESMLRALDGNGASTDAGSQVDRNQRDLANLAAALKSSGGNVQRAATMVGISRQRAYRLIGGRLGELAAEARPAAGEPSDDPEE